MNDRRVMEVASARLRRLSPTIFERIRMLRLRVDEASYSQEGEDRVLARYFESVNAGFYVDVGAHDRMRFSNTLLFCRRGSRGVNIDAMPGSLRLFNKYRPDDVNIESGVGTECGELPFYVFNEPALNSFDESLSRSRVSERYKIVKVVKVPVSTLASLINTHVPRAEGPSFLTVDVEGRDLDALRSNNWATFRPAVVLVECLDSTLEEVMLNDVTVFPKLVGYGVVAKAVNTTFYKALN